MKIEKDVVSLIMKISRLSSHHVRNQSEKIGMRHAYAPLLRPIVENDGLTQNELKEIVSLRAPTISLTLQNMESDGLIIRKSDKKDLRSVRVYITEKGKKIDKEIYKIILNDHNIALDGISEQDQNTVMEVLKKIKSNLEKTEGN